MEHGTGGVPRSVNEVLFVKFSDKNDFLRVEECDDAYIFKTLCENHGIYGTRKGGLEKNIFT